MNATDLQAQLCRALCGSVVVHQRNEALWQVDTPWTFPDGDGYSIYVSPAPTGGLRISDQGLTMMRLSYENDIGKLREGTRGRLLAQVLADAGLSEDDGEFFLDATADDLGASVLRVGQALTRVHDLTFLNRGRVESTFYEDLREKLQTVVGADCLTEGYVVPGVPNARDYPVDYFVAGGSVPLYLFGVPNRDKARLATIILQHLVRAGQDFNSMVVFQNAADLPRADLGRLMNAANDMIDSLDATDDFERKLLRRVKQT
jgi:Domain of unknown function DUF1828